LINQIPTARNNGKGLSLSCRGRFKTCPYRWSKGVEA